MQDLNKIRDEAVKQVIQIIEDIETDPLTTDEKKRVETLIEDAMTAPARDPGSIDDLANYVSDELGTKEQREKTESKRCPDCGKFFKPAEPGDKRCQECIDIANSDDEYYRRKRKEQRL